MTTSPTQADREAFTAWYYDQWSHGETTPVHHAHKKGCEMAWDAAITHLRAKLDSEMVDLEGLLWRRLVASVQDNLGMKETAKRLKDDLIAAGIVKELV